MWLIVLFVIGGCWILCKLLPAGKQITIPPVSWTIGQSKLERLLPSKTGQRYAIIGCGFLGKWLLYFLLHRGERGIVCADIVEPDLDDFQHEFGESAVQYVHTDITKKADLRTALQGIDTIFLTSAVITYHQRMHFQYPLSYNVNVKGTDNVVDVAKELGVRFIIQTSTSHVCVGNDVDQHSTLDEKTLYTTSPLDHYTKTKILAEKIVLNANSIDLRTVSVRPCSGIFGFGDRLLTEKFIRTGQCQPLIDTATIDFVYIENVCLGHLLAEKGLWDRPEDVSGEAFCISNDEPMSGRQFYSTLCHFYPQIKLSFPNRKFLAIIAVIIEYAQWIRYKTGGKWSLGDLEFLTPPTIELTGLTYRFCSNKARRVLGYEPAYTVYEGLQKMIDMYITY